MPDDKGAVLGEGDVYTWTALDTGTNLVVCWHVAVRGAASANAFLCDVAGRMASHSRLIIDERSVYLKAVELRVAKSWDDALLSKLYGRDAATGVPGCGPSAQAGTKYRDVFSAPDSEYVATRPVANPGTTMRACIGPYATVTGAFIRKLESHIHAISLHFMVHNFCRIHQPLRITPAIGAGVADHVWSLEEIVVLASRLPAPC